MDSDSDPRPVRPTFPIAIIGLACRLPGGADNPESFWQLLLDEVDGISEIHPDRWNIERFYSPEPGVPGKSYSKWAGQLDQIDQFEPGAFGISPREAHYMDPQQRLLLEMAWEALESGGQVQSGLSGSNTAVYVGISTSDYTNLQESGETEATPHSATGIASSIAANRISYCFDLQGPSMAVDTACSSSLVAVNLACERLWSGQSDMALAGGVNIILSPSPFVAFSAAMMLSPDGRCKSFDASADGFVRAEGAGMVVLKPLDQALADGDPVMACIAAAGMNQDARTNGIALPSSEAQETLLREIYNQAGIDVDDIAYIEAHGTGTGVGDPAECQALGRALFQQRKQPCPIGSVKSNIGHLEAGAGIAGLIKAALVLRHRHIPANLHLQEPNPNIPFEDLGITPVAKAQPLPTTAQGTAYVGVNSFGFGGTNAHVVLASHDQAAEKSSACLTEHCMDRYLLPVSAHSAEGLQQQAERWLEYLRSDKEEQATLADLCYNACCRRNHLAHRLMLVVEDKAQLEEQLAAFIQDETRPGMSCAHADAALDQAPVFVFSGQGPQWWGMARELLQHNHCFRQQIELIDAEMQTWADWSLLDELLADEDHSHMQDTAYTQPALFAIQMGLTALLAEFGIRPAAVTGHSVGEVAAACVAGALSLADAVKVIFFRGYCMGIAPGGRMLALGISMSSAAELVADTDGRISIAAHNGPNSVTLSGEAELLDEIEARYLDSEVFCRFLPVEYAFHSAQMDPVRETLLEALKDIKPLQASIPMISTRTGAVLETASLDANYWWHNVRDSVLFAEAMDTLVEQGHQLFLELSPHPVLATSIKQNLAQHSQPCSVLASLRRDSPDSLQLGALLAGLHTAGYSLNWKKIWPRAGSFIALPGTIWQRERYWNEAELDREWRTGKLEHPLLIRTQHETDQTWTVRLDLAHYHYLSDHRAQGHIIFPAAAYVEMALAASRALYGKPGVIDGLQFQKALILPEKGPAAIVQLTFYQADKRFTISSREGDAANPEWQLHCQGYLRKPETTSVTPPTVLELETLSILSGDACYSRFTASGMDYGPCFRSIQTIQRAGTMVQGRVCRVDELEEEAEQYLFHPALMDSCFQVIIGLIPEDHTNQMLFLPVRIDRIQLFCQVPAELDVQVIFRRGNERALECDLRLYTTDGQLCMQIDGFSCQAISSRQDGSSIQGNLYATDWELKPLPATASAPQTDTADLARYITDLALAKPATSAPRDRLADFLKRMDRLAQAYTINAFEQLGLDQSAGAVWPEEELDFEGPHGPLVKRLLHVLQDNGVLLPGTEVWQRSQQAVDSNVAGLYQQIYSRFPDFFAELTLLSRCGEHLSETLRGELDPLELLFAYDQGITLDHFYQDSASISSFNRLVAGIAATAARALPEGRKLKILEIGAGTGGLTSHVLSGLPADRTDYVFTDISTQFFSRAEQKFSSWGELKFSSLDIEQDPLQQEFEANSFDLVLASNIFHATRDLHVSLEHVRKLIRPGGSLLFLEVYDQRFWLEIVFGSTPGWWRFTDHDLRPTHPLISTGEWQTVLEDTGYEDIMPLFPGGNKLGQVVMHARMPTENAVEPAVVEVAAEDRTDTTVNVENEDDMHWLVLADQQGLADRLEGMLQMAGAACTLAVPADEYAEDGQTYHLPVDDDSALTRLLTAASQKQPITGVLYLWGLDSLPTEQLELADLQQAEQTGCHFLMRLLQHTDEPWAKNLQSLVLVTQMAHPRHTEESKFSLEQLSIVAFGRVVQNEYLQYHCRRVDLDQTELPGQAQRLWQEMQQPDKEDEVVFRGCGRFVPRLDRLPAPQIRLDPQAPGIDPEFAYRLIPADAGVIDKLALHEVPRIPPEAGQLEIRVHAAALNFRDVLKSLNLYPTDGGDALYLGDECAGIVTATGEGVTDFAPGDPVIAIAPGCFGNYVRTLATATLHKPKDLSFESAATLPITFLTAWYTLHELAHIQAGETILIQAAAGGVGLSALQLAQQAGARVFATAGTEAKRDLLRNLGVEHVLDSRSLGFADEIMQLTGGRGVDIVLNSLAGDAIARGIACLAPFGRFLELGKRDIYQDSRIGLWPFRQNLSFYGIDLSRLLADKPEQIRQMLDTLYQKLSEGSYHALPHRVFPLTAIRDAFGYMAKGRHTGKVVISRFDQPVQVQPRLPDHICFESQGSYLITGGLGGFGLVIAKWLISRGAKTLILASRRGVSNDAASQAVAELEALGAQVTVSQLDVSNADQVNALLAQIRQDMPPLRGIYHAAMVLDDVTLAQLDKERFRQVMAPKVDGCWNLHQASLQDPLEQFVMFSSISAIVGTPGQAHYAAANGFLDAFVHYRRSKGLAGLSINWGRLGKVGIISRNKQLEESLERRGFHSFSPTQGTEALERLLLMDVTQAIFSHLDWRKVSNGAPRFSRLDTIGNQADDEAQQRGHIRTLILESPIAEQSGMLREYIRQRVGKVLGVAPDRLNVTGNLNEMGLDSLMAVELINQLENDLDVSFRSSEIMQQPTTQTLVELAMKQLEINDTGDDTQSVSQEGETGKYGCLVPLQKGTDNNPALYCLHANDGKLDIYSGLADALPEPLPLMGIRSAWLVGERSQQLSLDELISQYMEDIIRHQPTGPYHLAGFSYGGLLALLTAHRLEQQGAEVAFVALLDSNPAWTDPDVAREQSAQELLEGFLSNLLANQDAQDLAGLDLTTFTDKLKTTEFTKRAELIRTTLAQLELDQAIKILLGDLIDGIEYHTALIEEMTLPVVKAPIYAWETRSGVTENYQPGERWAVHSLAGSDDKVIDCDHWALMETPNIQPIAEQLADLMQDDIRNKRCSA